MILNRNVKNKVADTEYDPFQHPDHNMHPSFWWNMDKAQSHYLVSVLNKHYPLMKEAYDTKIEVPPNKVVWLLHRYYEIHTRDKTPAKGGWVKEEALHEIPPSMLMKPESKQ